MSDQRLFNRRRMLFAASAIGLAACSDNRHPAREDAGESDRPASDLFPNRQGGTPLYRPLHLLQLPPILMGSTSAHLLRPSLTTLLTMSP